MVTQLSTNFFLIIRSDGDKLLCRYAVNLIFKYSTQICNYILTCIFIVYFNSICDPEDITFYN